MTDNQINDAFNKFEREFRYWKDGGHSYYQELAKKINNSYEKEGIISFLLREIANNKYITVELFPFVVIEELNEKRIASSLYSIYIEYSNKKSSEWREYMMKLFFIFEYKLPERICIKYIEAYVKERKEYSFHMLVWFVYNGNYTDLAIKYLTSYLKKYPLNDRGEDGMFLHKTVFLFNYLAGKGKNYLTKLVVETLRISKKSGGYLIQSIFNYINSTMAKRQYKEVLLDNIKKTLLDIS